MKKTMLVLAGAALLAGGLGAANLPALKDANKAKLDQIIGADFIAKKSSVPRVLVFYRCEGFVHGDAIVTANEAFRVAAAKTGAFKVDFSEDYNDLKADNLAKYDVLVMNNTTGLKVKEHPFMAYSLTEFTASGKGYVSLHAGVDTFGDCPQLAALTGGLFGGHPWGSGGTWAFKVTDAKSPINRAFASTPAFKLSDEIYQHREPPFDPALMHVLVALDFSDPETERRDGKIRPTSEVYPVSWIRPYGKGRVFYTTFGHDDRAWVDPKRLRHMFDGYLYCAGQLACDDSLPGIDVEKIKKLDSFQKVEAALRRVMGSGCGDAVVKDTVKKIQQILKDPSASAEVKEGCRKALRGFGAPAVVQPHSTDASPEMKKVEQALRELVRNPAAFSKLVRSGDADVRLAAVRNAGNKVPAAQLAAAYEGADARLKAAILVRLAGRNAPEGRPLANAALADPDEDLAVAAAVALRTIGTAEEIPALVEACGRGGRIQRNAEYAIKDIADPKATAKLFEMAGKNRDLLKLCARRADSAQMSLWKPFLKSEDSGTRKAAWRELSRNLSAKNLEAAVAWLASDFRDDEVSSASSAIKAAAKFAAQDKLDKVLPAACKGASAPAKRVLVQTMGLHPSPALEAALSSAVADSDASVRKAAADALGNFSSKTASAVLVKAYAAEKDADARLAELEAAFKVAAAASPDIRAEGLRLFKLANEADCPQVAKFILRSAGAAGFDDIQTLFNDPKCGKSAKAAFLQMYDELSSGSMEGIGKPITSEKWTAKANRNGHNVKRAFDGDKGSRWDTGRVPKIGDWFALGLGANVFVSDIVLNEERSKNDGLPAGEVYVSNDGETWGAPVAKFGKEATVDGITTIPVNAPGKWVKIVAKDIRNGCFWSIHEIEVKSGIGKDTLDKLSRIAKGLRK